MDLVVGILEQGLIYAIMALGIYITYKILDFPDLTVDGSFPLGAAITAMAVTKGVDPYVALLLAGVGGALAGLATGIIHVRCQVRDLLSGIITMTALYSINLHIAGKANLPIFNQKTIFNSGFLMSIFPVNITPIKTMMIILILALVTKLLLDLYLKTKSGLLLRAVGDNPIVVVSLARDSGTVKILGLVIANALVALSGSIICQQQRFFEITMGTGTMVIGLASVIIGTNLFKNCRFINATTAVVIGSILYKACVAVAITLGMSAMDMKLITAILFLLILIAGRERKRKVKQNA